MFASSECVGKTLAIAFTLNESAKLIDVDPQAWPTDVLSRIFDRKITKLVELRALALCRQGNVAAVSNTRNWTSPDATNQGFAPHKHK